MATRTPPALVGLRSPYSRRSVAGAPDASRAGSRSAAGAVAPARRGRSRARAPRSQSARRPGERLATARPRRARPRGRRRTCSCRVLAPRSRLDLRQVDVALRANSSRQRTSQPGVLGARAPEDDRGLQRRRRASRSGGSRSAALAARASHTKRVSLSSRSSTPSRRTVAAVDLAASSVRARPAPAVARRPRDAHRLGGRAAGQDPRVRRAPAQEARALPGHLRMREHRLDLSSASAPAAISEWRTRSSASPTISHVARPRSASRSSVTLIDPSSEFSIGTIAQLDARPRAAP